MADRIVGEYDIKVNDAIKQLDKLAGRVSNLEKQSKKSAQGTEDAYSKMATNLTAQFKNVAGALGIAFGAQQVIQLGKEMVTLAAQAEGVERAFKRVGSPQLLADLRKATRGTVSDIKLMTTAIQSANFQIPLENLAKYMQFAQQRARETGKSVDYLIESILTGVGRGSIEVWDNMGFSLTKVRENLNGVSIESLSVADRAKLMSDLVNEELAKMGDQADTTADRIGQITAAFDNFKVEAGKELIETFMTLNDEVEKTLKLFDVEGVDAFDLALRGLKHVLDDLTAPFRLLATTLQWVGERYQELKDVFDGEETEQERAAVERLQGAFESMRKTIDENKKAKEEDTQATVEQIRNVFMLQNMIKGLKEERDAEGTSRERIFEINKQLIPLEEELALLLGKETEATKKLREEREKLAKLLIADMDDPFAGAPTIAEATGEVDLLGNALNEAFGTEGTDRINAYWDEFMRSALEALDEVDAANDEFFDDLGGYLQTTLSAWSSLTSTVASLTEAQYNRQFAALENQLKREQITREEYDRRRAALAREQFQKQKEFAIVQAVINTALGVTNAFATAPNIILGAVLAAVVAAAGAAEIATISSQPVPQFAEGGFVNEHGEIKGRKHKHGGVLIEAEGGEFITSAKYARQNSAILKAINTGDWERYKVENIIAPAIEQAMSGGFENMGASYQIQQMFNDKNLLRAMDRQRANEREVGHYIVEGIGKKLRSNLKDRYV